MGLINDEEGEGMNYLIMWDTRSQILYQVATILGMHVVSACTAMIAVHISDFIYVKLHGFSSVDPHVMI